MTPVGMHPPHRTREWKLLSSAPSVLDVVRKLTEASHSSTEVAQYRCASIAHLSLDGELTLHVDLTTPTTQDSHKEARYNEYG